MKIALVSDVYAPRLGGIEVQVEGLARTLARRGHDVTVITTTPASPAEDDAPSPSPATSPAEDDPPSPSPAGVRVCRLDLGISPSLPYNPFAGSKLRRLLPRFDVVHVHCSTVSPLGILAATICARRALPALVTWHSMMTDTRLAFSLLHPLRHWAAAGVILSAVSTPAARVIESIGGVHLEVVQNSINAEPWASVRQARTHSRRSAQPSTGAHPRNGAKPSTGAQPGVAVGAPCPSAGPDPGTQSADRPAPGPLRVVTASRLVGRKRVGALIRAVRDARARGAAITLDVFGDGKLRESLERAAAGADWLTFHGRVEADELAAAYRLADLFVSPVVLEAFGIAALEAHAAGLPVVYMRGSGVAEFITDRVDGLEVTTDEELTRALVMLARQRSRLARLEGGALASRTGSWEDNIAAVESLYRKAIARRRGN